MTWTKRLLSEIDSDNPKPSVCIMLSLLKVEVLCVKVRLSGKACDSVLSKSSWEGKKKLLSYTLKKIVGNCSGLTKYLQSRNGAVEL